MTVDTYSGGGGWGDLGDVGLEDVTAADIQMPRLKIDHDRAIFKDPSTGVELERLETIILGLVKQRIMWDSDLGEGDKPQCKSPDNKFGFPQMRTDIPARKQFPWDKSNFRIEDFPPNADGQIVLPCESCAFARWGSDKQRPPCSEQYTYALYYKDPDGVLRPGIISMQGSGIKPARTYTGTFHSARQPMFTVWTLLTLRPESRGRNVYAVPVFTKGETSPSEDWAGYADQYRGIREFLHQPPRPATKEADEAEAAAKASKPTPASATAATTLSEDDPWRTSEPPASSSSDDLPF